VAYFDHLAPAYGGVHHEDGGAAIPFAGFQLSEARYVCAFFNGGHKSILAAFTKGGFK
jgi:hypothetical protein